MWAIIALASLAVLVVFLLCIPLDMVLHLDTDKQPRSRTRLVWLFGLVSKEIGRGKKKSKEKERGAEEKLKPGKRRVNVRLILQILRTRGLLGRAKSLLKGIFSHLRIRDLTADITVGLGDPADTGLLFAIIGPAIFFLGSSHVRDVRIKPSFEDEIVFKGYVSGALTLLPVQMVIPLLRFALSPPTLRTAKTLVAGKWSRRK